jgi:hypothetical protein
MMAAPGARRGEDIDLMRSALSHFRSGARFGKVVISHEPAAAR